MSTRTARSVAELVGAIALQTVTATYASAQPTTIRDGSVTWPAFMTAIEQRVSVAAVSLREPSKASYETSSDWERRVRTMRRDAVEQLRARFPMRRFKIQIPFRRPEYDADREVYIPVAPADPRRGSVPSLTYSSDVKVKLNDFIKPYSFISSNDSWLLFQDSLRFWPISRANAQRLHLAEDLTGSVILDVVVTFDNDGGVTLWPRGAALARGDGALIAFQGHRYIPAEAESAAAVNVGPATVSLTKGWSYEWGPAMYYHFSFVTPTDANGGTGRAWAYTTDSIWIERYPNGVQTRYKILGQEDNGDQTVLRDDGVREVRIPALFPGETGVVAWRDNPYDPWKVFAYIRAPATGGQ